MPTFFDTRDYRQRIIDYCRDLIQYHMINLKLRCGCIKEGEGPSIKKPVLDPNQFAFNKVHDIYRDINIFIAKSTATSVSDDLEETEYFKYLYKIFCITENIRTLIDGLPAIEALGKEYIENKYNSRVRLMTVILGLVAIVALISAGHDGVEFYVKSLGEDNGVEYYSFWFPITLGVCIISVIGLFFSVMR